MIIEKENTEHKIVEAAREVFINKGYDGSRMQEIADKAGINKALLHYYFRSKDKLFAASFESIFNEEIGAMAEVFKKVNKTEDLIEIFVSSYITLLKKRPYYQILYSTKSTEILL